MVGERKTAGYCVALLLLASAAGQVNSPAPCPNAIPQKSAKLTVEQKLVTALFAAVEDDNLRAVKRLLAQHADANARDLHCSTPLSRDADATLADRNGSTALIFAAAEGRVPALAALLEAIAHAQLPAEIIEAQDRDGWRALHHAASRGNAPAVAMLLAAKAETD